MILEKKRKMNKQELIKRINKLPCFEGPIVCTVTVNKNWILSSIEQLDQPQKVTVPQFLADWIFKAQLVNDFSLCIALEHTTIKLYANNSEEILKWLEIRKNQETFALAWVNGYEVEQEKRYLVKVKNLKALFCYLAHSNHDDYWSLTCSKMNGFSTKHTKKELEEAGFGWVFDCPGIEIEEVE